MHKQMIVDAVLRLLEPRHKAEARSPRPGKAA